MPGIYADVLEIIPQNEIDNFYNIIARESPTSTVTLEYIKTSIKWNKNDPTYEATFYRYKENIESGIFVSIIRPGYLTTGLYIYACEGYEEDFEHVLLNTKKIPWNETLIISGVLPRHTELVEKVIRSKNYIPKVYVNTTLQYLDVEMALNYKITYPPDVYTKKLTHDDIDFIYDQWPHKDMYTKDAIRYAIDSLSFGVFSKKSDELLAWVMQTHYGAIGMLYTIESARGNGYAKLLVKIMSKELAKLMIHPYALIMESNTKSLSLFHSVGFRQITRMKYIIVSKE